MALQIRPQAEAGRDNGTSSPVCIAGLSTIRPPFKEDIMMSISLKAKGVKGLKMAKDK
jgi:hypothetical protein